MGLLIAIAATTGLWLLTSLLGFNSQQWIDSHHCIPTGNRQSEEIVTLVPIDGTGESVPVWSAITRWEYLCDDRDDGHWLSVKPPKT